MIKDVETTLEQLKRYLETGNLTGFKKVLLTGAPVSIEDMLKSSNLLWKLMVEDHLKNRIEIMKTILKHYCDSLKFDGRNAFRTHPLFRVLDFVITYDRIKIFKLMIKTFDIAGIVEKNSDHFLKLFCATNATKILRYVLGNIPTGMTPDMLYNLISYASNHKIDAVIVLMEFRFPLESEELLDLKHLDSAADGWFWAGDNCLDSDFNDFNPWCLASSSAQLRLDDVSALFAKSLDLRHKFAKECFPRILLKLARSNRDYDPCSYDCDFIKFLCVALEDVLFEMFSGRSCICAICDVCYSSMRLLFENGGYDEVDLAYYLMDYFDFTDRVYRDPVFDRFIRRIAASAA